MKWLAEIYAGGTPSKENESFWKDGVIPWLNSGAVNQKLIRTPSAMITDEALKNSSAKWVPEGALVVALAGQGKTKGTVAQIGLRATVNQSLAAIVPKRISARYLFYFLEGNYRNLRSLASDDLRDGLNLEILGAIDCPIPPPTLQADIATLLDRETAEADALVTKYERLIELLEEKRVALITQAVTKGLDPSVPMKDSRIPYIGEIPRHWGTPAVWTLFTLGRGRVLSHDDIRNNPGDYPVYSSQTESGGEMGRIGTFDFDGAYLTWTTDGANAGTVFVRSGRFNCTNVCGTLKPYLASTNLKYFQNLLNISTKYYVRLDINPKLMNDVMARIRLPEPPYREQTAIQTFLDRHLGPIDHIKAKLLSSISLVRERRSALITAAVTGEIDVNNYRPKELRLEVPAS